MSLFDQMAQADETGRGRKIQEPELNETLSYVVRVDNHELKESRKGLGTLFIVEFTMIRESVKEPVEGRIKVRKGDRCSWVQFPSGQWAATNMSNIKSYGKALLDSGDEEPTSQDFRDITENKYVNILLDLDVEHVKTQGAGRDYYVHIWRPYRGPDLGDIVRERPSKKAPDLKNAHVLDKDDWLSGKGAALPHPQNPAYEWNPEHPEWGVREKA